MRKLIAVLFLPLVLSSFSIPTQAAQQPVKEWTFLVFLNGHNNLDSFGFADMNEMEKVGSTQDVNVVVQWASLKNKKTKRVYVTKDNKPNQVTSPALQELPAVDMGDYRSLVEFVQWGVENFPAKHYFIDVWNHGSGWHKIRANRTPGGIGPMDISFDDNTGNVITTQQLGLAMEESAKIIGHKVDLYGSDACLMGMAEVAAEMSDSVHVFAGSQELEPGAGWPYDTFLQEWTRKSQNTPQEVAQMLTNTYIASYGPSGSQGEADDITFSSFDLSRMSELNQAISLLAAEITKLPTADSKKILDAAERSQAFFYSDYIDLGDFIKKAEAQRVGSIDGRALSGVSTALKQFVVSNKTSSSYANATGVAIWLPTSRYSYDTYSSKYAALKFPAATGWATALEHLLAE